MPFFTGIEIYVAVLVAVTIAVIALGGFFVLFVLGVGMGSSLPTKLAPLNCPHCGKETSASLKTCQHCGRELQ